MIASTQTNAPLAASEPASRTASPLDLATARLKTSGLRITQPRIAILAALSRHVAPVSIEQIHAEIGEAKCDLVTVYRCMSAFEKIGVVSRAFFHNGTALFKLALGQPERYHVVCKESNRVDELDPETSAELRRAIEGVQEKLRSWGYGNVGHIVEFFGVAPSRLPGRHAAPVLPASN
jgi:Fur family ferric uptake transcriptional regulator